MRRKVVLLFLSVSAATLGYFLARTKGLEEETGKFLSQVFSIIKDGDYPNFRIREGLEWTVEVRESEEKEIWSRFNLKDGGLDRFEIACLRQIRKKIQKLLETPRSSKSIPLDLLQPEITLLALRDQHEEARRNKRGSA